MYLGSSVDDTPHYTVAGLSSIVYVLGIFSSFQQALLIVCVNTFLFVMSGMGVVDGRFSRAVIPIGEDRGTLDMAQRALARAALN